MLGWRPLGWRYNCHPNGDISLFPRDQTAIVAPKQRAVGNVAQEEIRVLVVDDSAVIRALICDLVAAAPGLSVAGRARHGREALEVIPSLRPDVVTLDIQMPDMDGLAVLDAVLRRQPTPVIMVSALTHAGAAITLEALDRGAVDYVAKPGGERRRPVGVRRRADRKGPRRGRHGRAPHDGPTEKGRAPAAVPAPPAKADPDACPAEWADKCVALGVSTGGPPALEKLLGAIRPPAPPMVIVQHMPPQFHRTAGRTARRDLGAVGPRGRHGRRAPAELRADRPRRQAPGTVAAGHAGQDGGSRRRSGERTQTVGRRDDDQRRRDFRPASTWE